MPKIFNAKTPRRKGAKVLDCGGRAQRRHRFRAQENQLGFEQPSPMRKRRGASLPAAVQNSLVASWLLGSPISQLHPVLRRFSKRQAEPWGRGMSVRGMARSEKRRVG